MAEACKPVCHPSDLNLAVSTERPRDSESGNMSAVVAGVTGLGEWYAPKSDLGVELAWTLRPDELSAVTGPWYVMSDSKR